LTYLVSVACAGTPVCGRGSRVGLRIGRLVNYNGAPVLP
jgi:hypothetical protein